MVDPHPTGCLEPEVLAAYVDRGLSLTERARVDAHLASCPQCIALVAGVARTVAELPAHVPDLAIPTEATPLVTRRSLAGALAAAAAVLAVIAAPSLLRPWLDRDAGLVSLVESVGEQRSVLGRLTGGFPHAPLGAPSAGGQDGRPAGTDRILLTAGKIRESFGERPTPSQLHAIGVAELLAGRYDDAAQSLLAASREQPANARYLSDVSAVQLERARRGLRPDDLPRALAAADRARQLDPSLKEAWFNRALAVTALSLTAEARAAWIDYLRRDGSSSWSVEARSRLEELNRETPTQSSLLIEERLQQLQVIDPATADNFVRTQITDARDFIEKRLIAEWATAVLSGQDASRALDRLRTMAQAMLRIANEPIYADVVNAIDRATASGSLTRLAQAHEEFLSGTALFNDDRFSEALPHFWAAHTQFDGTPFALLARVNEAAISYITGRQKEATAILITTLSEARAKGYLYAAARSSWFLGLLATGQSRFDEAETHYRDTLETFERMGDVEQAGAAHNLLAVLYDYLGDAENAWQHRLKAFAALNYTRSAKLKSLILATAVPSIQAENPETALAIQDMALTVAREIGREAGIAEILAQRASLLASLNLASEAAATAREAREHLTKISDVAIRNRIEVGLLATESDLVRASNPAAAVAAATTAIDLVRQRNDRLRIAQLSLRVAQANLAWGRTEDARVALNNGLEAFNAERRASSEVRPVSALDESWQLFDTAVQLALQDHDYPRAFALADTARVRSASEFAQFGSATLAEVQRSLAPNEAIIALNQFHDALAVWVIRRSGTNVISRPLTRSTARALVTQQQSEVWRNSSTTIAGRELYNQIIRPAARYLVDVERFVIVPDAVFQDVSFAALYDVESATYLIEQKSLRRALSGGAFVASTTSQRKISDRLPLIFDGTGTTRGAEIRAIYRNAEIRSGADATPDRLFSDGVDRPLVHISAQALGNPKFPLLSRLLINTSARPSSILARDLVQHRLPDTELVVVDGGGVAPHRGEGTSSIARAFLAAGVAAVLGTLPGADETATRDLLIAFHREISRGIIAEQALQTVQRNAIQQNGRRLGAWTALVLYGSDR